MSQYLVVAEVDKIQSFIFRSSRLREVIGGSVSLVDFSQKVKKFSPRPAEILVAGGGTFILVFHSAENAKTFGANLQKKFEAEVGGSITVAEPTPYDGTPSALEAGRAALRRAKLQGKGVVPVWHVPYHALCASCGTALAEQYKTHGVHADAKEKYLCQTCLDRSQVNRKGFFNEYLGALTGCWRGQLSDNSPFTDAETYATGLDPHNYVAYLVADGNEMGIYFSRCSPQLLPEMSSAIGNITQAALAEAVCGITAQEVTHNTALELPALPLIAGGDDLFVLMPASWALDVAAQFCDSYQTNMTKILTELGEKQSSPILHIGNDNQLQPATTGAAVVICKASYPYKMAHQRGHELLEKVKSDKCQSMFALEVILGADTIGQSHYFPPLSLLPQDGKIFLEQRYALRDVPNTTLEGLREALLNDGDTKAILNRVKDRTNEGHTYQALETAMTELGYDGMRELLKLWDFTYSLQQQKSHYLPSTLEMW